MSITRPELISPHPKKKEPILRPGILNELKANGLHEEQIGCLIGMRIRYLDGEYFDLTDSQKRLEFGRVLYDMNKVSEFGDIAPVPKRIHIRKVPQVPQPDLNLDEKRQEFVKWLAEHEKISD